jgi:hypothetical protein
MAGYHFDDPVLTTPRLYAGWLVCEHLSGAQSATLLRTPETGKRIHLEKLVMSVTSNAVVSLNIGDWTCFQAALTANVPMSCEWPAFGSVDESLTVTSSAGLYINITGGDGA